MNAKLRKRANKPHRAYQDGNFADAVSKAERKLENYPTIHKSSWDEQALHEHNDRLQYLLEKQCLSRNQ